MKKINLVFVLCFILSNQAYGANDCGSSEWNVSCFDCGKTASDHCTARLDGTKLTVVGKDNAQMKDYSRESNPAPWGINITSMDFNGVSTVGAYACDLCRSLKEVTFSDTVTSIGGGAFNYAPIKNVVLPQNLVYIGNDAFSSNAKMESIIIPDTVTDLRREIFQDSTALKSIVIGAGVTFIGDNAFTRIAPNAVIYCQDTATRLCEDILTEETKGKDMLVKYTSKGSFYVLDGKEYRTLSDMQKGEPVKRIYTIEEASKLSKQTGNTFMLRYK